MRVLSGFWWGQFSHQSAFTEDQHVGNSAPRERCAGVVNRLLGPPWAPWGVSTSKHYNVVCLDIFLYFVHIYIYVHKCINGSISRKFSYFRLLNSNNKKYTIKLYIVSNFLYPLLYCLTHPIYPPSAKLLGVHPIMPTPPLSRTHYPISPSLQCYTWQLYSCSTGVSIWESCGK